MWQLYVDNASYVLGEAIHKVVEALPLDGLGARFRCGLQACAEVVPVCVGGVKREWKAKDARRRMEGRMRLNVSGPSYNTLAASL